MIVFLLYSIEGRLFVVLLQTRSRIFTFVLSCLPLSLFGYLMASHPVAPSMPLLLRLFQALSRLFQGSIQAVLRLYSGSIKQEGVI